VAHGAKLKIPGFVASSAGTRAVTAHPIHERAASVLEGLGGDPTNFAARQLTPRIASEADLILTMTRAHRDRVLELAPRLLRRTFTLTEAARLAAEAEVGTVNELAGLRPRLSTQDSPDVPDPIGLDAEVFAAVGMQIAELLPPILEVCLRTSTSNS
jgi:protein-tyrosine phosphatase